MAIFHSYVKLAEGHVKHPESLASMESIHIGGGLFGGIAGKGFEWN